MQVISFIKRHILSILFAAAAIYIMCLIFSFSAQNGTASSSASKGISHTISEIIVKDFSSLTETEKEAQVESLVPLVRKTAHFLIYCALAFFSLLSPLTFFRENKSRVPRLKVLISVALFCLCYAASDELHQMFVDGRDGNVLDVLLDFCGALCGLAVSYLSYLVFCKSEDKSTVKCQKYQK